jgi:hypothetical protein
MHKESENGDATTTLVVVLLGFLFLIGLVFGTPSFIRYQQRANAENKVQINNTIIQQTAQLVQVEQQKGGE